MTPPNPASQVIAALIVGLLLAFTCQLLLTNFGLALGISLWGGQSWQPSDRDLEDTSHSPAADSDESSPVSFEMLSIAAGLGLLLTVNGVLFLACYGAVKFAGATTAFAGAILGGVIWAAYMLVMTWVSTSAANSLIAFILTSAVAGLRQIFTVLGSLMQSTFGESATTLTPAAVAKQVQQETQFALEQINIPDLIETYIDEQMSPALLATLEAEVEAALRQAEDHPEPSRSLPTLDKATFTQWIAAETDLSGDKAAAIASQLHQAWQRRSTSRADLGQPLQELFATASANDLTSERVSALLKDSSPGKGATPHTGPELPSASSDNTQPGLGQQLKRTLRQRLDLTDLDLQTVWQRVSPLLQDWLREDKADSTGLDSQVIRDDVDEYLQAVAPWRLNQTVLQQEFQDVLRDPEAADDQALPQLKSLGSDDFRHSLTQRGDLAEAQIEGLTADLEAIRQAVIVALEGRGREDRGDGEALTEAIAELQHSLENYLHYTSLSQITPDAIAAKVAVLVEESSLSIQQLHRAMPELPQTPLATVLDSRQGLDDTEQGDIVQQVQAAWQQQTKVASATTNDGSAEDHVPPETIAAIEGALILAISQLINGQSDMNDLPPELMQSLSEAVNDPNQLRRSLEQLNWPTLRAEAQRQLNISDAQVDQAIQQVRTVLTDFLKPPRRWALRRSAEVSDFWTSVTEYLTHSSPDQLTPEALRHNLTWLWQTSQPDWQRLQDKAAGAIATLDDANWNSLKAALEQRQDLASDQIEVSWQVLQQAIQQLLHSFDEARQEAQTSLSDWFESVQTLLQATPLLNFDTQQLKNDLQALLKQPSTNLAALAQPLQLWQAPEGLATAIAQLSQDALKQLLIAQGVPQTLLDQAAGIQTWMQERVTAIEQDIQQRQAALKQAALQQLDTARQTLAAAAWWLFAIALTSATTAAVAGILATGTTLDFGLIGVDWGN